MDEANATAYEAVPVTCFACAARDAERRHAHDEMQNDRIGKAAFDGLLVGVVKKEAAGG